MRNSIRVQSQNSPRSAHTIWSVHVCCAQMSKVPATLDLFFVLNWSTLSLQDTVTLEKVQEDSAKKDTEHDHDSIKNDTGSDQYPITSHIVDENSSTNNLKEEHIVDENSSKNVLKEERTTNVLFSAFFLHKFWINARLRTIHASFCHLNVSS